MPLIFIFSLDPGAGFEHGVRNGFYCFPLFCSMPTTTQGKAKLLTTGDVYTFFVLVIPHRLLGQKMHALWQQWLYWKVNFGLLLLGVPKNHVVPSFGCNF